MRKFVSKHVVDDSQYVGHSGELVFINNEFRIHDGITENGNPFSENTSVSTTTSFTEITGTTIGLDGFDHIVTENDGLGDTDDGFFEISLDFPITWLGVEYSSIFIGSNSYITFETGSDGYGSPTMPGDIGTPALIISSADNSFQRLAWTSTSTVFRVRYEGTDATSGNIGESNIIWEAVFQSSLPNTIDVFVELNARGADGSTGLTSGSKWIKNISDTPLEANHAYRFYSPAEIFTGNFPIDFETVIFESFGSDSLFGYYKFDDKSLKKITDSSSNGLHGLGFGGVTANRPSPINDGNTGFQFDGGSVYFPYHAAQWGGKSYSFTIGFAFAFTNLADYIEFEIFGGTDEGATKVSNLRMNLWNGSDSSVILYNDAGNTWLELRIPSDKNLLKAGVLVFALLTFDGEILTLRLNDKVFSVSTRVGTVGTRIVPPGIGYNGYEDNNGDPIPNLGMRLHGGIDSPHISHFFVSPYLINNDFQLAYLMNGSGLISESSKLTDDSNTLSLIRTFAENTFTFVTVDYHIMGDDSLFYRNRVNSGYYLLPITADSNNSRAHMPSPINDGNAACMLIPGYGLKNNSFEPGHFASGDFSTGIIYKSRDLNPSMHLYSEHVALNDVTYKAWELKIEGTNYIATLYKVDGSEYLSVSMPGRYRPGDTAYIAMSYLEKIDTLTLYVNGWYVTTNGSFGGDRMVSLDNLSVSPNYSNPSVKIDANGTICHWWFTREFVNPDVLNLLYNSSGIQSKLPTTTFSGSYTVGDKILVIENGLITDIQST